MGSADHAASSSEKLWGLSFLERDKTNKTTGDKASIFDYFLKGSKYKFYVHNHSPWSQEKGGWQELELCEKSLEQETLGRDVEEKPWGFMCWDIPGFHSSHFL